MNTIRLLTTSCILLLLYSCNTSLSVLSRRYRPGYTVEFSKDCSPGPKRQLPETILPIEPSPCIEELTACIDEKDQSPVHSECIQKIPIVVDPIQNNTIQAQPVIPENKSSKSFFFVKKKRAKQSEERGSEKPLEPFNLIACFLIGAGILAGVLLQATGLPALLLFLLTLGLVFIFSLISMRRMEKYPERYSKVSKILNYIFALCGIIVFIIFWIIFKTITTEE